MVGDERFFLKGEIPAPHLKLSREIVVPVQSCYFIGVGGSRNQNCGQDQDKVLLHVVIYLLIDFIFGLNI